MARIDKARLTKTEILTVASRLFLSNGYTNTSIRAISNELEMSTGNVTFYFPTKEHILVELTQLLCTFQGKLLDEEESEGYSSIMGICLELASMAVASELDENMRDIFCSSYTSPMTLEIIRRNDADRAKQVFSEYCKDWTHEDFVQAETLVSGIEYATLMVTSDSASLETRIKGALTNILKIYNVPKDIIDRKIEKVFALDYRNLGKRVLTDFKRFVDKTNEQAIEKIVHNF